MLSRRTVLLVSLTASPLAAQTAPVRIVVGFPAGATPDTLARLVAAPMAQVLGRPVIVDNRPGAGSMIAADHVAKAAPDGTTLLLGNNGPLAINRHVAERMPFDAERDFRPVAFLGVSQQVLLVRPGLATDFPGFLAAARAREISYASVGAGSASHLVLAGLAHEAGLKAQHVPYRGAGPALVDMAQGRIDAMIITVGFALPQIVERRVVALALTGPGRLPQLPELPTLREAGMPGYELPTWNGLFAPAATPDATVRPLVAAAEAPLADPAVRRGFEAALFTPLPMDAAAIRRFIAGESARWGEIARATGARLTD
jgi:tripartite-type tricarboxylate transporter receptor subunit TctC